MIINFGYTNIRREAYFYIFVLDKKITMAKVQSTSSFKKKPKVKRPGVIAKTKCSCSKTSKNYVKSYKGQGR
jgi:hypothetical protein